MKKWIAAALAVMILTLAVSALAVGNITLEDAKRLALEKAGIVVTPVDPADPAAQAAVFTKAYPDTEDGRAVYEIEFYVDATEYEMEVDAATGEITDFETEAHSLIEADGQITEDAAKAIALAFAGLKAEDVTFKKTELDREDGVAVYEIEFTAAGMEYEFDIEAATGKILKSDVEKDD